MKEFVESPLLGSLARILTVDISAEIEGVRFSCRPLASYTSERNTVIGRFKGQIGLPDLREFQDALDDLMSKNISRIILDFAAVFLSKSAVGALIAFAAAVYGHNKRLYLYRPSPHLRAVLKELEVTAFFSYLETEDDIIAAIVL
jgi:anti-anti-sigma regulatory factor